MAHTLNDREFRKAAEAAMRAVAAKGREKKEAPAEDRQEVPGKPGIMRLVMGIILNVVGLLFLVNFLMTPVWGTEFLMGMVTVAITFAIGIPMTVTAITSLRTRPSKN
jgi:hypothetical protein